MTKKEVKRTSKFWQVYKVKFIAVRCTHDLGQDSPIQTDLAWLIRAKYYF